MTRSTHSSIAPECPYCGYTHPHDGGFFYDDSLTEYACESCDNYFNIEVSTTTYWRCTPKDQSND